MPLKRGREGPSQTRGRRGGLVEAPSLVDALRDTPVQTHRGRVGHAKCLVRVPRGTPVPDGASFGERAVTEERDWPNQVHVGRSIVLEGFLDCGPQTDARTT